MAKAPTFKREDDTGLATLLGFMLAQQSQQKAGKTVEDIESQFPQGLPPGSEARIGKETSINIPLNRKLTKEEVGVMGMADAFDISTKQIENFMNSDPVKFRESFELATAKLGGDPKGPRGNVFGVPTTIGNEDAQYLNFLLEDMADRVLRLRSGAQINENEFQRLRSLLPTFIDVTSDEDGSFTQIRRKVGRFRQEFSIAKERIRNGTKFEDVGFRTDRGDQITPGTQLTYDPDIWGDFGPPIPGLNKNRRNI